MDKDNLKESDLDFDGVAIFWTLLDGAGLPRKT